MKPSLNQEALAALEAIMAEFRALDLPYGSKAYTLASDVAIKLRKAEPFGYVCSQHGEWKFVPEYEGDPSDTDPGGYKWQPVFK